MLHALTSAQAREAEECAVAAGMSLVGLMRSAGAALAASIAEHPIPGDRVVVACGPGNNGGDGWVCARELHEAGYDVSVAAVRQVSELSGLAADAAAEAVTAGVAWSVPEDPSAAFTGATTIVDALLGTGSTLPLREPLGAWCSAINASGARIIAADIPTGVDPDTGAAAPEAVKAHFTVALVAPKRGHVIHPGAHLSGEVLVDDLGVPESCLEKPGSLELWAPAEYAALLPVPRPDTHKNARGRVLVVAGSGRYPGAAVLAARGAARMGAGYVTVAVPEPIVPLMQSHLVAQTVVGLPAGRSKALSSTAANAVLDLAADYDAVLLGPGLSLADGAVACVRGVVPRMAKPLIVDADALNALVDATGLLDARTAPTVLTPHPGELARLLSTTPLSVQADRVSSSARLAAAERVVVLKGAGTLVTDGARTVANTSGSPALATAGSGDVLAGMIAALLAQGLGTLDAAALAVNLHGSTGDVAGRELTEWAVTAEDLPSRIPQAVRRLLEDG